MKITEITQLEERPGDSLLSKLPGAMGARAAGRLSTKKVVDALFKKYYQHLGASGEEAGLDSLKQFLVSFGMPEDQFDIASTKAGVGVSVPGEQPQEVPAGDDTDWSQYDRPAVQRKQESVVNEEMSKADVKAVITQAAQVWKGFHGDQQAGKIPAKTIELVKALTPAQQDSLVKALTGQRK